MGVPGMGFGGKGKEQNTTRKVQEVVINKIPKEINNNTEYVDKSLEDDHVPNEYEISINFVQNGTTWNRNKTRVDEIFAYAIASEIINDEITVPKSIGECRQRNDWQKWQDAIQAELDSLEKTPNREHDPVPPKEHDEDILGPEILYLSAIGALMYLANNIRPDIAFSLVGYADAGYLSYPHKARSQTGYVFTYGDTAISWRSTKQSLTATSSNHAELIALYEAGRECVWLRSMIQHIQEECGLESIKGNPTILYEDNAACIAQIKEGYIKGDKTKHSSLKFFFTYDLQMDGVIDVCQV
ncbi:retrovirus-related pol polyprotein from transposon TNT 1-94 [Tanacetum coccineum]